MAQPVAWPQPLDQVEDAGGDVYWNTAPEIRNQPSIASRREGMSGGGGVL